MKALRVLCVAALAAGCATNPATGKRQIMLMSEAQEIQLGRDSDAEIRKQMGVYGNAELQRYVESVGMRLAQTAHRPGLPWKFTVVDEPAVNAFALPGGFIYITRGILPYLRNEAELAAVMAHEVGHVDARHSAQQYSNQTLAGVGLAVGSVLLPHGGDVAGAAGEAMQLAFLKNSRGDELQADQLGVGYAATSGWRPDAMPALLATLARIDAATGSTRGVPNWAMTHPPAADRVERVQAAVAAAPTANTTNKEAFESHLEGIVVGDTREKGIVRGTEFIHPVLRFAVRFPQGWEVINSDEQVSARQGEQSNVAMLLQLASGNGSPQQLATSGMATAGWQLRDGQRTEINGLEAYVGVYDGVISNTRVVLQAAHVRAGNQTYVVAGLAPASQYNGASRAFSQSIGTFRTISREEADRIQPDRLDFYTVRGGDTWDALARRSANGSVKGPTLAIMNGSDPATPPRAGQRIRIVVGG